MEQILLVLAHDRHDELLRTGRQARPVQLEHAQREQVQYEHGEGQPRVTFGKIRTAVTGR